MPRKDLCGSLLSRFLNYANISLELLSFGYVAVIRVIGPPGLAKIFAPRAARHLKRIGHSRSGCHPRFVFPLKFGTMTAVRVYFERRKTMDKGECDSGRGANAQQGTCDYRHPFLFFFESKRLGHVDAGDSASDFTNEPQNNEHHNVADAATAFLIADRGNALGEREEQVDLAHDAIPDDVGLGIPVSGVESSLNENSLHG